MSIPLLWTPRTGPLPDACGKVLARMRLLVVERSSKRLTGLVLVWGAGVGVEVARLALFLSWLVCLLLGRLFWRLELYRPLGSSLLGR